MHLPFSQKQLLKVLVAGQGNLFSTYPADSAIGVVRPISTFAHTYLFVGLADLLLKWYGCSEGGAAL